MIKEISHSKCLVTLNAVCKDGIVVAADKEFVSTARVLATTNPTMRVVELRFVVPATDAEDIFDGMRLGSTELLIQDIPPKVGKI